MDGPAARPRESSDRPREAPRLWDDRRVPTTDHHSAYLAKALAALTPEGHARVDALLDQLSAVVGDRERLVRFARARRAEADAGRAEPDVAPELTPQELQGLLAGFRTIRDEEPLDDVADWANAVVALLEDEAG
jgi:hypothetical protein